MSLSFWATRSGSGFSSSNSQLDGRMPTTTPASSTSLNFLAAVLSAELVIYSPSDLSLRFVEAPPPVAGTGAHAAVQVGRTIRGTSVAVKRSRAKHIHNVDTHFAQATLELRILSHERLRQHPHIVDILGLCLEPMAWEDHPEARVQCPNGTPLLNAPEVRNSPATRRYFDIGAALQTDVFSFGLLLWEVIKNGWSFLDETWLGCGSAELSEKEAILNTLPHNILLFYGHKFLSVVNLEPELLQHMTRGFDACLQDEPSERKDISAVVEMMHTRGNSSAATVDGANEINSGGRKTSKAKDSLTSWTTQHSLIELLDVTSKAGRLFLGPEHSFGLQQHALEELKALAISPIASYEIRAHAAMTVSECYATAFGTTYSNTDVLHWLDIASLEGHTKASCWYNRVHEAIGPPTLWRAQIRLENKEFVDHIKNDLTKAGQLCSEKFAGIQLHTDLFISDDLLPLHVAALLGEDMIIAEILCNNDIGALSAAGFTVAHYACVGGHLSTLRLVLERDRFELKAHDIVLESGPLEWAVITRNRTLVNALLPHSKNHVGIQYALSHYYYEIASDILCDDTRRAILPPGYKQISFVILRPFRHWIAHGHSGPLAIQRTIEICAISGLIDHSPAILNTLVVARAQSNIKVLEYLLELCPISVIKREFQESMSNLHPSFHIFRNNPAWDHILRLIVNKFSVAELSEHAFGTDRSYNFLHLAIAYRHVSYMRTLLEKGVSANSLTEGPVRMSPLELCVAASSTTSREMWMTLLEYGAKVDNLPSDDCYVITMDPELLHLALAGKSNSFEDNFDDAVLVPTMHRLLAMCVKSHPLTLEAFRVALSCGWEAQCLNSPNQDGLTMLQYATVSHNTGAVKLLLDAGADASVPFIEVNEEGEFSTVLPLQMIC
ncbi:hypothetical protein HYALB_00012253 [Hymenoscyphus albidus]|uniref:Protein kinase domain-containing protein n=1 Tax=Hymenoscyphus albidus TaxID=595503 RepID=A0A9N9LTR3_9HELO|nr:hypothetical protein HYALB_00012253 [Hymenoscyphus albidus]